MNRLLSLWASKKTKAFFKFHIGGAVNPAKKGGIGIHNNKWFSVRTAPDVKD
jgi:hypothetical protein